MPPRGHRLHLMLSVSTIIVLLDSTEVTPLHTVYNKAQLQRLSSTHSTASKLPVSFKIQSKMHHPKQNQMYDLSPNFMLNNKSLYLGLLVLDIFVIDDPLVDCGGEI